MLLRDGFQGGPPLISVASSNEAAFSSSDCVPALSIGPRAEQHQVLDGGFKNREGTHSLPYSKGLDLEDRYGQKSRCRYKNRDAK